MKVTFKKLREFSDTIARIYERNPNIENTKFGYAVKRFSEQLQSIFKDYNKAIHETQIDHALINPETRAVLLNPAYKDDKTLRPYLYDKAGTKKVVDAENAILDEWDKREYLIDPYIVKSEDIPHGLLQIESETLKGLML